MLSTCIEYMYVRVVCVFVCERESTRVSVSRHNAQRNTAYAHVCSRMLTCPVGRMPNETEQQRGGDLVTCGTTGQHLVNLSKASIKLSKASNENSY